MADNGGSVPTRRMRSIREIDLLHFAMLALQFGYAGFHVVTAAALNAGMSKLVFIVYRNILALVLVVPFAYFREKTKRPALTLSIVSQFFLVAFVGITASEGFYMLGLDNTSPTFASAIKNSVLAVTFLLKAIRGIENVNLNRYDGVAKVVGTACCVAGATVITLYKGSSTYTSYKLVHEPYSPMFYFSLGDAKGKNWTLGCLFLMGHCLSWSSWFMVQESLYQKYPAPLSTTSFICFFGLIQLLIISVFAERSPQNWVFNSGHQIFFVFYAGVVQSGIAFALQKRVIHRRGSVFVAVYQPLQTLIVASMASLALGEEFYLGGIIGAIVIIVGHFLVLWGTNEEKKMSIAQARLFRLGDQNV